MHLGNGAITPECAAFTGGLAVAGLAAAGIGVYREFAAGRGGIFRSRSERATRAAAVGCLIFAAQAVNVPIGTSTSAHLVGGVLAAWALGPALGIWAMALVLAIQAIALGDGGLAALGANVVNMAIVPAVAWTALKRVVGGRDVVGRDVVGRDVGGRDAWCAGLAAAVSIPLAAGLIVLEVAAFRQAAALEGLASFSALMLGTHLLIGVLEGVASAAIVAYATSRERVALWRPAIVAVTCAAALVAALVLPISSALPDGYEAAAEASGMEWLLAP